MSKVLVKREFIKKVSDNGVEIFNDENILNTLNDYFATLQFSYKCTESGLMECYIPFHFSNKNYYKYEEVVINIYLIVHSIMENRLRIIDILNCNVISMGQLYILFDIKNWNEKGFKRYLNDTLKVFNTHINAITDDTFVCSWKNLKKIIDNYSFEYDEYRKNLTIYIYMEYDKLIANFINRYSEEKKIRIFNH